MQYKSLTLQLLEHHPPIHDRLKSTGKLLAELDRYSTDLKTSHSAWTDLLSQQKPGSDPSQITSEALEIALRELEQRLSAEPSEDGREPLNLDAAMAFLRDHTSPA
jgi:hypothetical protein